MSNHAIEPRLVPSLRSLATSGRSGARRMVARAREASARRPTASFDLAVFGAVALALALWSVSALAPL